MKRGILILTLLSAATLAGAPLSAEPGYGSVIPVSYYGENDLRDYYQAGQAMRRLSESTVALFAPRGLVRDAATGNYTVRQVTLRQRFNLQAGEAFAEQPAAAYCSGVLVGPDLVLTAGHCFQPDPRGGPCAQVRFLFGYAVSRAGAAPSSFPAEDVYSCREIVAQQVKDDGHNIVCSNGRCAEGEPAGKGADFALVRLDRPVANRTPLAISRSAVRAGASVGAIGYPSGMPVKIQESGSTVRTVTRSGYFVADLDTFGGNSGSPVFNLETFRIEGILVRGGVDYVYTAQGSTATVNDPRNPNNFEPGRANVYPQGGGRGEDVTLISEVQALIPATEMEAALDAAVRRQSVGNGARPKAVPAIYTPGQGGLQVQPAIYTVPEPAAPQPVWI
jgi:V8-like Glu-specific endopeptidase